MGIIFLVIYLFIKFRGNSKILKAFHISAPPQLVLHSTRYSHTQPIPVPRVRIVVVGWWEGMECIIFIKVIKDKARKKHNWNSPSRLH